MAKDAKYGEITTEHGDIPDTEPVFMMRARDMASLETLGYYLHCCVRLGSDREHMAMVLDKLDEFRDWQTLNKKMLKVPDSHLPGGFQDV